MLPIGDDNSGNRTFPIITYALIAANLAVFFLELTGGDKFIITWSFIPRRFLQHPTTEFITILTAMFMHAGWLHLLGNMLYLWIFGDNVEDRFGHFKFLLFYLVCGVVASITQFAFGETSKIPNIGASGAIAGVLGAYILLFPKGRVYMLFFRIIAVPAWVALGIWIVIQVISGAESLNRTVQSGGVAYMAHIGGFLTGLLLAIPARARLRN